MLVLRRVIGESMLPTLQPGQIVCGLKGARVRRGDVVIFSHDGIEKIKRVTRMERGFMHVLGDNSSRSKDSKHFGALPESLLVAKVVYPFRLRRYADLQENAVLPIKQ